MVSSTIQQQQQPTPIMMTSTRLLLGFQLFWIVSVTTAFHHPITTTTTRMTATQKYASRIQKKKHTSTRSTNIKIRSSRLQYNNLEAYHSEAHDNNTNNASSSTNNWWHKLLQYSSSATPGGGGINSRNDPRDATQKNVDSYLEFLDRRYRRIHAEEEEDDAAHERNEGASSSSFSFSALEWLVQGTGESTAEADAELRHTTTNEDHKNNSHDALHMLGLAGLASQELLQKHQHQHQHHHNHPSSSSERDDTTTTNMNEIEDEWKKTKTKRESDADADDTTTAAVIIDVDTAPIGIHNNNKAEEDAEEDFFQAMEQQNHVLYSSFVMQYILLPVVHVAYFAQQQKHALLQQLQLRVWHPMVVHLITTDVVQAILMRRRQQQQQGQRRRQQEDVGVGGGVRRSHAVVTTLLSLGGGKHNIVRTLAFVYSLTLFILRPALHQGLWFASPDGGRKTTTAVTATATAVTATATAAATGTAFPY